MSTISRGVLRRMIGNSLGDVTELSATANGSTTTFIDTVHLSQAVENPLNRGIVFTSGGVNVGAERRVTAYDFSTGTITFAALSSGTSQGDICEMYNFRGRGWTIPELHRAIAQAIEYSWPLYREPYSANVAAVFDSTTGLMTIPATFTHVYAIQYQDTDDTWRQVPSAVTHYGQGWTVNISSGVIDVRGMNIIPNGATVRLEGFKKPTAPATETATTTINAQWLVNKACAILCMGGTDRDPANYNLGQIFDQKAERTKSSIRTRLPSGTVAVV